MRRRRQRRQRRRRRRSYLLAAGDDGPAIILIDKGMNDDCYFQGAPDFTKKIELNLIQFKSYFWF